MPADKWADTESESISFSVPVFDKAINELLIERWKLLNNNYELPVTWEHNVLFDSEGYYGI